MAYTFILLILKLLLFSIKMLRKAFVLLNW